MRIGAHAKAQRKAGGRAFQVTLGRFLNVIDKLFLKLTDKWLF